MNIEHIRYFVELSECTSLSQAASKLFITQQGLSKAISSIENELDVKLVRRNHKGVMLTDCGREFHLCAKKILTSYDLFVDTFAANTRQDKLPSEQVTLTCTPYVTYQNLLDSELALQLFEDVLILERNFSYSLESLSEVGTNYLCFVDAFSDKLPQLRDSEALRFDVLYTSRLGVLMSRDYALEHGATICSEDIVNHPVAFFREAESGKLIKQLFARKPLQDIKMVISDSRQFKQWVINGNGLVFCDSYNHYSLIKHNNPSLASSLCFVPFSDELALITVGFLYRKDSKAVDALKYYTDEYIALFTQTHSEYFEKYSS